MWYLMPDKAYQFYDRLTFSFIMKQVQQWQVGKNYTSEQWTVPLQNMYNLNMVSMWKYKA